MSDRSPEFVIGFNTFNELVKKAIKVSTFEGFMDPKIFSMSFGWFQTKKKRGYTEEQAQQFMEGFGGARRIYLAVRATPCPKCKAPAGLGCTRPNSAPTGHHADRRKALARQLKQEDK